MKTVTFSFILALFALTMQATTWTVTNVGESFSPSTITVTQGDTIIFNLMIDHNVVEVSEDTWNMNGAIPLDGGFELPLGGGMLLTAGLAPGIHFYVCQPHASMGMKGIIEVETTSSVQPEPLPAGVRVFPNPANATVVLSIDDVDLTGRVDVAIYDISGRRVYFRARTELYAVNTLDVSALQSGIYTIRLYGDTKIYGARIVVE